MSPAIFQHSEIVSTEVKVIPPNKLRLSNSAICLTQLIDSMLWTLIMTIDEFKRR